MKEKLFIYYSNDLHSHFHNWTKVVQFFNNKKQDRNRNGDPYWLVDIGDHVDRSHPISEAMMGKANVELLNDANIDIATIGNNEGITLDYNDLYHLYDDADFQLICANLESTREHNPAWLKRTFQVTSPQGVKIGFIGLTAPFNAFYNQLGWNVKDPFETLEASLEQVKATNDIIILLSHLGLSEDEEIARRFPEIDVIIGGHTHHLFRHGEYINETLLTAAGKHCYYAGEVILTWDFEHKKLEHKEAYATRIDNYEDDAATLNKINAFDQRAKDLLSEQITKLKDSLDVNWFEQTELITKLVAALKDWTEAEVAMLNAGLLLESLPAGKVSYLDVHRICPHPINPCVVHLTGAELIEAVRGSLTKTFQELQLKGFGFRGEVLGRMVFSGIQVETHKDRYGEEHVKSVTINETPIQKEKIYKVATADMFTFGKLIPEVARSEYKKFYMPEFLRDILVYTLKNSF